MERLFLLEDDPHHTLGPYNLLFLEFKTREIAEISF